MLSLILIMVLFFFNVRFFAQLGEKPHIEAEEQAPSECSIRVRPCSSASNVQRGEKLHMEAEEQAASEGSIRRLPAMSPQPAVLLRDRARRGEPEWQAVQHCRRVAGHQRGRGRLADQGGGAIAGS